MSEPLTGSGLSLARNEAGTRFPHAEEATALEDLLQRIQSGLQSDVWQEPWRLYEVDELSEVETANFVESGLMTPEFAENGGEGRGFAVYGDGVASLEIGGVDQIRLLAYRTGQELIPLWALLSELDDGIESFVKYAFDPFWGYLTALPDHAGSGLRAFATVHTPGLMLTGRLAGMALDLTNQGFGINPIWGGAGGVMQVSNLGRQGEPEYEAIQRIENVSKDIVEKERAVRKTFVGENSIQVLDYVGRAVGIMQHSRSMSFGEAVNLLSAVQVGLELDLVEAPGLAGETVFNLMRRLQAAHVVLEHTGVKQGGLESPEIDQGRAGILRELFANARILS